MFFQSWKILLFTDVSLIISTLVIIVSKILCIGNYNIYKMLITLKQFVKTNRRNICEY